MLDDVKARIEVEMASSFGSLLPSKYLRVRGYASPHRELFAYLTLFLGRPVPAAVLRIITVDAVHTERRGGELRDSGFAVGRNKNWGAEVYILRSPDPDVAMAARTVVAHNVKEDKNLSEAERRRLLDAVGG